MMQDVYAQWPYEDLGIEGYGPNIDRVEVAPVQG
jgi:hypothetical protein